MNLALWLERSARQHSDRPALFLGREMVATYGQFRDRAAQVAAWLAAQGVMPGDRIAIFMKNVPDYLVVQYGAWWVGAAVVPINAKLHGREAVRIIKDSGARTVFATEGLCESLANAGAPCGIVNVAGQEYIDLQGRTPMALPATRGEQDLSWLFYTSGTTGRPKGVMITNAMLVAMTLSYQIDVDVVSAEDAAVYAAPLSHGAGIYNMMHVLKGARHVLPPSGGFDEEEIFDLARYHGRVHMFAAPTMVRRMTQVAKARGEAGEGLRTIVYGGGPMYSADIVEAVDHFGQIFVQIYGQGECPMAITALSRADVRDRSHPRWRERLASVGRAQSVVEVRVGDEKGNPLPVGQHGEIMVRGATVMPGYWKKPGATQKTLINGWLMTGDMGFLDADGYLTMQDRSRDVIISGGSNIYPREVEEVLMAHPSISEVSVVGRPHTEWGEEVVAFVVLKDETFSARELDAHCLSQIARFKRPKDYIALPELPKNNYGKVLKTKLRALLREEDT